MGMFDTIYLDIKCPHCKNLNEIELQTKDGYQELSVWRKGDNIRNHFISDADAYIVSYGNCGVCNEWVDVKVTLQNCVITGEYTFFND
jgi:phage FluMu protein Com